MKKNIAVTYMYHPTTAPKIRVCDFEQKNKECGGDTSLCESLHLTLDLEQ